MSYDVTRCPYCGSTRLFTDYDNGTIVCMDCGVVLVEGMVDPTGGVYSKRSTDNATSTTRAYKPIDADMRAELAEVKRSIARRVARMVRAKRGAELHISLLKEEMSRAKLEELQEVLSVLEREGVLRKLGDRTRIAVAEIVMRMLDGVYPPIPEIARKHGVSVSTLRRIVRRIVDAGIVEKVASAIAR